MKGRAVSATSCTANYANITVAQAVPALAGLPMDKSAQNQRTHSLWALPIGIVLAALITAAVSAVVAESCCRLMSAASERWSDWRAPGFEWSGSASKMNSENKVVQEET